MTESNFLGLVYDNWNSQITWSYLSPAPPDAQQGPHQSHSRRCWRHGAAGVAQVAAAAAVGEARNRRKHLAETRVIAVRVPDTLTDRLSAWGETSTNTTFKNPKHNFAFAMRNISEICGNNRPLSLRDIQESSYVHSCTFWQRPV